MPPRKHLVARAFGAAENYDGAAAIQRVVADGLARSIARQALPERPRTLEIGCGTGFLTGAVRQRIETGTMIVSDLSPTMAARCRLRLGHAPGLHIVAMDGERPCLAAGFDLICSSLAAQWFADLPGALAGLAALLAPGGLLAVTTLAAGTFREWREAHASLGLTAATPAYPSLDDLRTLRLPACTIEVSLAPIVETHADGRAFLAALRAIGAQTPGDATPLSSGALRRVLRRFDAAGATVTYEVATCLVRRA